MAVQQILGKQITKFDTEKLSKNPNFVQSEEPIVKKEVVNGNTNNNTNTKVYQGEMKPSQNIYGEEMKDMMSTMMGKIDNVKQGKVNNKVNKLRALRKNGS